MFGSLLSAGANLLGGLLSSNSASDAAAQNIAMQKEFAQDAVTWKAADARRAEAKYGINPLVSMGTSTNSFSNVVGGDGGGAGVAAAGQDLGRAANAYTDSQSRVAQLNEKLIEAKIANVNSDTVRNQAAASQMVTRRPGTPGIPNFPMPREDPRGPLMFAQWRDMNGDPVWLPRADAAMGLQTTATAPVNAAIASRSSWNYLMGNPGGVRGDAWRDAVGSLPPDNSYYSPF